MLRAVNHAWEKEHREVYAQTVRQELEVEFSQVKDAEKAARDTPDQLTDKGLLDKRKPTLEGKGEVVLFRPYGAFLNGSIAFDEAVSMRQCVGASLEIA